MPEKFISLLHYIPFFGLFAVRNTVGTPLITRLLEMAVMAAVAAGFATFVGVEILKKDVSGCLFW